jgi:hypothetical protein
MKGTGVILGAALAVACTPDFVEQNASNVLLRVTGVAAEAGGDGEGGATLISDIASTEGVFNDNVTITLQNLSKNPSIPAPGAFNDVVVERYQIRYVRSDGHNAEGVDVPFSISGGLSTLIPAGGTGSVSFTVVRHQAKFEPPLVNIGSAGGLLTMFAQIDLFGRTTSGQAVGARATLEIAFGDFGPAPEPSPLPSPPANITQRSAM